MVGVSAWMNQSDTNAEAPPPTTSNTTLVLDDTRGWCSVAIKGMARCARRYCITQNV